MEKEIKKLLVIRFSAMGDVAMTIPVISLLAQQHPNLRITMLTRKRFVPMFEWTPANVDVKGIDLEKYEGMGGLLRLFRELYKQGFDAVADLHDVLRTKFLRTCFRGAGMRVSVIDKGRKDKKRLLASPAQTVPLKPMYERYADTFRALGFSLDIESYHCDLSRESLLPVHTVLGRKKEGERWIGVAPFAAHDMKVYPLDKMREAVRMMAEKGWRVFLFGAGKTESAILSEWEGEGIISVCGRLGGLRDEMLLISQLDRMVSMDSANMHLAAMLGTPVLGIWGATHPKAGFNGWGLTDANVLQIDTLQCRPCSIYGNKPCRFGDHRCMLQIHPKDIVDRV